MKAPMTLAEMAAESRKHAAKFRSQASEFRKSVREYQSMSDAATGTIRQGLDRLVAEFTRHATDAEKAAERWDGHAVRQEAGGTL